MTDYLELTEQFETQLSADLKFELLEIHYTPYSFGSGMSAYKIKGCIVKIIFDGRDNIIELLTSVKHLKYPSSDWTTIFTGKPTEFIDKGLTELKNSLNL